MGVEIDYYNVLHSGIKYWSGCEDEDIEEVLAPVPTYDQFSQLVKKVEGLKQQLAEANKILFNVLDCREDREYYTELAEFYFEKYGVEK